MDGRWRRRSSLRITPGTGASRYSPRRQPGDNHPQIVGALAPVLSAFRPIEDHPGVEVFCESLEAMDLACRHKQQIAGDELRAFLAADELAAALHHDVD